MISLLLLTIGAIIIPLLSLGTKRKKVFGVVALYMLAGAFVSNTSPYFDVGISSMLFAVDDLGRFFIAIFLLMAFLVGLFSLDKKGNEVVFYSMLLAGTASMIMVALARNLIGLFIGLELLSLCFYELCALKKNAAGLESAIKLFFMSIIASSLFVLGAVLVYSQTRSFELTQFLAFTPTPAFLTGFGLLLSGLFFKMGLFPFNFWLPDVYEGAPSEITALLAGSAKKAGFVAFLRFVIPFTSVAGSVSAHIVGGFGSILAAISLLTISFGNVVALVQTNIKRMIAYSIIAHAGFLVMGLAAGTALGYLGLLFHILIHALMAVGTFLLFAAFDRWGMIGLDDFDGLGKRQPLAAILLTIFLLSLTGIPPLAGFLSKFILWSSAVEAGYGWLAFAAIVNSALSTYFYVLILRRVWGSSPRGQAATLEPMPWNERWALIVPAVLIFAFGVYPNPILVALKDIIRASGLAG